MEVKKSKQLIFPELWQPNVCFPVLSKQILQRIKSSKIQPLLSFAHFPKKGECALKSSTNRYGSGSCPKCSSKLCSVSGRCGSRYREHNVIVLKWSTVTAKTSYLVLKGYRHQTLNVNKGYDLFHVLKEIPSSKFESQALSGTYFWHDFECCPSSCSAFPSESSNIKVHLPQMSLNLVAFNRKNQYSPAMPTSPECGWSGRPSWQVDCDVKVHSRAGVDRDRKWHYKIVCNHLDSALVFSTHFYN